MKEVSPLTGLANRRIRPLCHLSGYFNYSVNVIFTLFAVKSFDTRYGDTGCLIPPLTCEEARGGTVAAKSTKAGSTRKPKKSYEGYPLFAHATYR